MNEEFDINELYLTIFGRENRPNLFCEDDEEYNLLRQEILNTKPQFYPHKELPFSNITLISYEEYQRYKIANDIIREGKIVFYIRKYNNNQLTSYAAGYFDPNTLHFYVVVPQKAIVFS